MTRFQSIALGQPRLRSRVRLLLPLLAFPLSIFAASNADLDNPPNQAKNLARMNCGAKIECITPDGRITRVSPLSSESAEAAALIMEDDTVSCALPEGETNFVIALPNASLLDRFTFLNENAAARGELRISVSNYRLPLNSPKWTPVEGAIPFSHKRTFDLSLLGVEAKFVKLSFRVEKKGRIAGVGLYGEHSLNEFAARQSHIGFVSYKVRADRAEDQVNFNFANLYARARIVHVSSGSITAARKMIDDDPVTSFQFAADDPHPTVVVELSDVQRLHRVSAVYDMQPGRLDVYTMPEVGGDPANVSALAPVASETDLAGNGKAGVNFDPHGARYVTLRWTPMHSGKGDTAFSVAEIDAFGNVPLAALDISAPRLFASNNAENNSKPGEGPPDFSNTLGTLADPPVIPDVSP
jgi:hypothetical protein